MPGCGSRACRSSPGDAAPTLIAVLAGGTGGAKLARGLLDVVPPAELTAIANTGDDVEFYGVHVSPDPDLVTYWLADLIDEQRGYGIRGDTWHVMDALESTGRESWFRLGDRDLANCLARTALIATGGRLTEAAAEIAHATGVAARVLPMTDDEVRTHVLSRGRWIGLQEYLIVEHAAAPVEGVEVRGADAARASPEVLAALRDADAIVIGPSNPVISIGPILAVPGIRAAIAAAGCPVVAVSPFVEGHAVKGPTDEFCRQAGIPLAAAGIAMAYEDLVDGVIADEPAASGYAAWLQTDTLMDSPERRRELAASTLEFAMTLRR
jgi:LPPG:FO 2-phospho-L-lactate transferase